MELVVKLRKVENGYVLKYDDGTLTMKERIFLSLEDATEFLKGYFFDVR